MKKRPSFPDPTYQIAALVGEHDRRHVHVEVPLQQPLRIRRHVPVLQRQVFGRQRDDGVGVAIRRRIVLAVAGFGVDRPVRSERVTGSSPQPAAAGIASCAPFEPGR